MNGLRGLAWLLALQSIGELLARGLALPFPGPVIGMILLLFALRWPGVREPVAACAKAWAVSAAPLLDDASGDAGQAEAYARYYVENILRPRAFRADCIT